MAKNYVIRPGETLVAEFDLREFVAEAVANGAAPADVQFLIRSDAGITVSAQMGAEVGLVDVTVTGGVMGRVYSVAVEAECDGDSKVEVSRVRLRDPSLLPSDSATTPNGDVMTDPDGDLLVDPAVPTDFVTAL